MNRRTRWTPLAVLLVGACAAPRAVAADIVPLVAFGPATYATQESVPLARDPGVIAGESRVPFSAAAPLSPQAGYTGPAFLGGALLTNNRGVPRRITRSEIRTGGAGAYAPSAVVWSLATTATNFPGGGRGTFHAVVLFPESSWLPRGVAGAATLHGMACEIVGANPGAGRSELRWVVRVGDRHLISEETLAWSEPGSNAARPSVVRRVVEFPNGTGSRWAAFDPGAVRFDPAYADWETFYALVVEAVGVHVEMEDFELNPAGGTQLYFGLREFRAFAEGP